MRALGRFRVPLVLGWLTLVHFAASWLWLDADAYVLYDVQDQGTHISSLVHLVTNLELGGPAAVLRAFREFHQFYPSAAQLPLALPALILGPTPTVYRLANVFYFVLFLLAVYRLGRLCRGQGAGLLAAALGSLLPAVYGGWRTVGLDYPLVGVTPWAIYFLLASDGLRNLRRAAAFGAIAGLAVLIKGHALVFLFWPAALLWARALWRPGRGGRGPVLLGGGLAVGLLAAVSAVWWWGRLGFLTSKLLAHFAQQNVMLEDIIPLHQRPGYVLLEMVCLSSVGAALALVLVLPRFYRTCRHRHELLAWLLLPLGFFIALGLRQPRYLLPLAPVVALILGCGLWSLGPRLRAWASGATAAALTLVWIVGSYSLASDGSMGPLWTELHHASLSERVLLSRSVISHPPRPAYMTRTHRLTRALSKFISRRHPGGEGALLFFSDHQQLTTLVVALQEQLPGLRLQFHGFTDGDRLYTFAPPRSWRRYALMRNPGPGAPPGFDPEGAPAPAAPHQLILRVPCGAAHEEYQCHTLDLYQLAPTPPWPPWLLNPDPRGLSTTGVLAALPGD